MLSERPRTRYALVALALATVTGLALAQDSKNPTTPEAAIKALVEGNERYASYSKLSHVSKNTPATRKKLVAGQAPFAAIIRCADSRVAPEIVFDQPLGKLFVCGVAGNIPTTEIIASLEYGVAVLKTTKVIVVMGHSSCGAVDAAIKNRNKSIKQLPGSLPQLVDQIIVPCALDVKDPESAKELSKAIKCNANMGIKRLVHRSPVIRAAGKNGDVKIIAGVLDLKSGRFKITGQWPHTEPNVKATPQSGE